MSESGRHTTEILAPDAAGLARAAELLRAGALVAFPTETVYGLGADATDGAAVAAIYAAKGRPRFNPLIAHYPDAEAAFRDVVASPLAERLAARFWPGPLTLVRPRRPDCRGAPITGAGLATQTVRVPSHPLAMALLAQVGRPVAAPSANRSGQVSPTTAAHVLAGLAGRIAAVLDGGPCAVGVESTVLDLSGPEVCLLRPGGIAREAIEAEIGPVRLGATPGAERGGAEKRGVEAGAENTPHSPILHSPGLLRSHYAPSLPVRLEARTVAADEALLAFGPPPPGAGAVVQLSAGRDLAEAAARLFAGLIALDEEGRRRGLARIAVMPVPEDGLGLAINDRLQRAAAPRGGP